MKNKNREPLDFFGGVHLTQQRVREWYFIIIVLIKSKNFYKRKAGTVSFLNNIRSQHSFTIHWWVEWCDVIQISQQIKMQARAITNEPTASVFSSISHHSRTICWWVEWGGSIHYSVKVIDDARTFKIYLYLYLSTLLIQRGAGSSPRSTSSKDMGERGRYDTRVTSSACRY